MTCAFILNDDTILCYQTPDGMHPLCVALPHLEDPNGNKLPKYQLGRVQLFKNLAPHYRPFDHYSEIDCDANTRSDSTASPMLASNNAAETMAISYDYACANDITLPSTDSTAFVAYRQLITRLPAALCDQLSQAIQLLRWQMDTQFCSRCAAPVVLAAPNDRAMVCSICDLRQYPRVQPCVITAITRPNPNTGETQILLAHHHRYGTLKLPLQYGLIAGFVEVGESLEHAVAREVDEEVGITLKEITYVSSQPWPYPSNLMLGFRASYSGGDIVLQEDELSHADFFDLSNLPKIPAKGSIAHNLIAQIACEEGVSL